MEEVEKKRERVNRFVRLAKEETKRWNAEASRQRMTTRTTLSLPQAEWFQESWETLEAICGKPQDILLYCTGEHFVAELENEAQKKDYVERFKSAERRRKTYVLREMTVALLKKKAKDLGMSRNELIAALVGIVGQSSKDEIQEKIDQQKRALAELNEFLPQCRQFKKRITEIFEGEEEDQDPLQRALCAPITQLEDAQDIAPGLLNEGIFLNLKFFEKEGYIL